MMCSTFSTSTANWMVLRQLRSVCDTTLATLRWTKMSPGGRSTIWVAGTRESEQPIHRYFGACCCARRSKKRGSWARTAEDQARLLSSRLWRGLFTVVFSIANADVFRLGEEAQRFRAAFAAEPGLLRATKGRAQVAQQPAVDPHDAEIQLCAETMRARQIARPHRCSEAIAGA